MIGHVAPEAASGGPIAAVGEGDVISIDATAKRIDVDLAPGTIAERLAARTAPARNGPGGVMAKYAHLVSCASEGAVTTVSRITR